MTYETRHIIRIKGEEFENIVLDYLSDFYEPGQDLCLVEGPFDVMKLYEHGIPAFGMLGKELGPGVV